MDMVIRGFAFVFLGIGLFLVYGARNIHEKTKSAPDNGEQDVEVAPEEEDADRILNIKKVGVGFVIVGVLLVLAVFR